MAGIYFIGIIFMLVSMWVSWRLKSKFKQYSQTPLSSGLSGREVAEMMLADNGITDVRVISVAGRLTDHYNPADKTVLYCFRSSTTMGWRYSEAACNVHFLFIEFFKTLSSLR